MSGTEKSHAALLDELAALDRRSGVSAETFAEVPDGMY